MKMITICIITKNDANYLESIFNNIKECFNKIEYEVMIVDMESTDATKDISMKYTEKVYEYDGGNMIEAKKFSIKMCETDWILYIEADEIIKELKEEELIKIMKSEPNNIGVIKVVNHSLVDGINISYIVKEERLFNKNKSILDYRKDQGLISKNNNNKILKDINIQFDKLPYIYEKDNEKKQQKIERKISQLNIKIENNPEEPYNYFLMGMAYKMLNDLEMARAFLLKGLELPINPDVAYIQLMVVVYGNILLDLEEYEEALLLENVYDLFDGIADFLCLMGQIYLRTGFIAEAIREYTKATNTLGCIEKRSRDIVPNYNLGCIYEVLGDIEIAKKLYARCGDYSKAKERLEQLN